MRKYAALLFAALLLAVALFAGAAIADNEENNSLLPLAAAIAGIAWLYGYDLRREKRDAARAAVAEEYRFKQLAQLARSPQFTLSVSVPPPFMRVAFATVTGALCVTAAVDTFGKPSLEPLVFMLAGAPLLVGGLLGLVGIVSTLGKPAIILSATGFQTPWFGAIPWECVEFVYLQNHGSGINRVQRLMFEVPDVRDLAGQYHWLIRWAYRYRPPSWRRALTVSVRKGSEKPQVVYRIASLLWAKRSGREWDPNVRAELDAWLKRMAQAKPDDALLQKLKALASDFEEDHRLPPTNAARAVPRPDDAASKQLRRMRMWNRMVWFCATIVALSFVYRVWIWFN